MKGKGKVWIIPLLSLLLITLAISNLQSVQTIETNRSFYIRADGSVDPSTAPIQRNGNVYIMTDDIIYSNYFWDASIVVERDNIVIDGAGYTVRSPGGFDSKGIFLSGRRNITIRNMEIRGFDFGILLSDSSENNTISGNNITGWTGGIRVYNSSDVSIIGNTITYTYYDSIQLLLSSNISVIGNNLTNNGRGLLVSGSSEISIIGNTIRANRFGGDPWFGICLDGSNNTVSRNIIVDNLVGVAFMGGSGNKFYQNGFINNDQQVWNYSFGANVWDYGYPSGGNYWSDYTGIDLYSGPYQNKTGSDGIGDTPHVINQDNIDRYPLISPRGRALFECNPEKPWVGENIVFNASASYFLEGIIASYQWDFGDGTVLTTTLPITFHAYTSFGNYTITLE
jgi:parallel beta-helix repeat protein